MCCSLQNRTIVVAIIWCIADAIPFISAIAYSTDSSIDRSYSRGSSFLYWSNILIYVFVIVWCPPDVLCLIGACTKKRYMLLPFIVKTGLIVLVLPVICIFSWDVGLIVPLAICILFSCVTAIHFFNEIGNTTSGRSEEIILQPISSQPTAPAIEVVPDHLHLGEQNQTCEHQEQPPAYESLEDLERNVGIKSDCSIYQV